MFGTFGKTRERRDKEIFDDGMKLGLEEGIHIGMKRHFEATSELSEEENELLIKFLVRHNFVMCYETNYGGFRIRKNDKLNPQLEKKMYVVDDNYMDSNIIGISLVSLVRKELMDLDFENHQNERTQYHNKNNQKDFIFIPIVL